jgi:hypothetical protein
MGYKPTYGGIKKLQEFLKKNGCETPIFLTSIVLDNELNPKGVSMAIDG